MILQYRGFNRNWCLEESNTITWAKVDIGDITRKTRKCDLSLDEYAQLDKDVEKFIKEETGCDDITYLIGDNLLQNVDILCVVSLDDKDKHVTYAFVYEVYILNNQGSTVHKIA